MAKVKAPLLSMRASGTIGDNLVFASWRGVPYVRQHVIPSNPRSVAQLATRDTFRWLNDLFRNLGPISTQPWTLAAVGRPFTDRNALVKSNLAQMRNEDNPFSFIASPGVRGGPPLLTFASAVGVVTKTIDVDVAAPELPEGWTVNRFCAQAIKSGDPKDPFVNDVAEAEDPGPDPVTLTLTVKTGAFMYHVSAWAVYNRPDGSLAVGPSSSDGTLSLA